MGEPPLSNLPTPPTTVHPRMGTSLPPGKSMQQNVHKTHHAGAHHPCHNLRCGSLEKQQVVERIALHPAAPNNPPLLTPACNLLLTITPLLLHMLHFPTSSPPLLNPLQLLPKERERRKELGTKKRSNKVKQRSFLRKTD